MKLRWGQSKAHMSRPDRRSFGAFLRVSPPGSGGGVRAERAMSGWKHFE